MNSYEQNDTNIEYDIDSIDLSHLKAVIDIKNINNCTELIEFGDKIISDSFKVINMFQAKFQEYRNNYNIIKLKESYSAIIYYMKYLEDAKNNYSEFSNKVRIHEYSKKEFENTKKSFEKLNEYHQGIIKYLEI